MRQFGLSKIEVLMENPNPSSSFNLSRNLEVFEDANFTLSGDYLIITERKEDDTSISKVLKLSQVYSYKITNNNIEI